MQLTQFIDEEYERFLKEALYSCVRVQTKSAGGSGQVIHSSKENGTFILTCEHVIDDAITIKKEWSPVLQQEIKKDIKAEVEVEFFKYSYKDRASGSEAIKAKIIAYDKNEDIAILKLKDNVVRKYVAKLMTPEEARKLKYFDNVVTIGAALGHPPVATVGHIESFNDVIENRDYMLCTAPLIFGNSGGATFSTKDWKLIGMPARISVVIAGFSADPITHLGYIVPCWRIFEFYKEQMLEFLYDKKVTYKECVSKINTRRKKSQLDRLLEGND